MARRWVPCGDTRHLIAEAEAMPEDLRRRVVLRCTALDELTGQAPEAALALQSDLAAAEPRVAPGGICGLVARPRDVSAALTRPGGFSAEIRAPGYLPRDLTPAIEAARRSLTALAPAGAADLTVAPPDPAPRRQFQTGRVVAVARPAPTAPEHVTTVRAVAAPGPSQVPMTDALATARPPGTGVAGVPLVLVDQPLHRAAALTLRGRVRLQTGPGVLLPGLGAQVAIRGVWWDYPSTMAGPALPPDLGAVIPALRAPYPVATSLRAVTLADTGTSRTLVTQANPGDREIRLATPQGLAPGGGDVLRLGSDEVVTTAGFDAGADPALPVLITLRLPVAGLHHAGMPVVPQSVIPGTALGAVAREALPGDRVLFAPGLPALPTLSDIEIGVGTPGAAIHRVEQLPTTPDGVTFRHTVAPDGTGRFSWPPLARLAQIRIDAVHPPQAPLQIDLALDYGADPALDLILT